MDPKDFSPPQDRHLVNIGPDGWAYLPPPLPPELDMARLALPLAEAAESLGELKGAARRLQNPYMLIGPLLRREALTSSAMEGTITTLHDMLLDDAGGEPASRDDAREAMNYTRAIQICVKMLGSLPISHRMIKHAHEILLTGLSRDRGANKRPGEYRVHQNAIGRAGDTIASARFVPPPSGDVQRSMDRLEGYINRPDIDAASRIIDLALVHYQFETIHPFDDGNGRIGRMLITLLAQQSGLLDLPTLHVSPYLENRKDEYIDRLFAVSSRAEWEEWIEFFLRIVAVSAGDATEIVDRIIGLQAELRAEVQKLGKSHHRHQSIIDGLFEHQWTTATRTAELCGVSFPTARSDLSELVVAGILRELRGGTPTIYFAPRIQALSSRPQA